MQNQKDVENEGLYRSFVFYLFETASPDRFSNSAPAHATCIFEAMLKHAEKEVRIFCKKLSRAVYDNEKILNALRGALARGVAVKVLTQEAPEDTEFLKLLKEKGYWKKTEIEALQNHAVNFAVMDHKAFRYEKSNTETKAFACANEPTTSARLAGSFDLAYSM